MKITTHRTFKSRISLSTLAVVLNIYLSPTLAADRNPVPINEPNVLAKAYGGWIPGVSLINGSIFFSDAHVHELRRVSRTGGEILTVLSDFNLSPGLFVHRHNRIFGVTNTGIVSLPEDAEGITTLSRPQAFVVRTQDVATDGVNVYWTEEINTNGVISTRVLRIPIIETVESPIARECGCSTDRVFAGDLLGFGRIVLDGDILFASEGQTGNIYRHDLTTGIRSQLATGLSSGLPPNWIPLVVTRRYLYALVNGKDLLQINKLNGSSTLIVHTAFSFEDVKIRSDQDGVYWWERGANAVVLKRFDEQTASINTLATVTAISSASTIFDFQSDGTWVWWMSEAPGYRVVEICSAFRLSVEHHKRLERLRKTSLRRWTVCQSN